MAQTILLHELIISLEVGNTLLTHFELMVQICELLVIVSTLDDSSHVAELQVLYCLDDRVDIHLTLEIDLLVGIQTQHRVNILDHYFKN